MYVCMYICMHIIVIKDNHHLNYVLQISTNVAILLYMGMQIAILR